MINPGPSSFVSLVNHSAISASDGGREAKPDVAMIIREFLSRSTIDYMNINGLNTQLEDEMRAEIKARNISSRRLEKTIHLAASLIELAWTDCPFEEKKTLALFNWCILYIDDASLENVEPFVAFQQRFQLGLPQLDPVLDMFAAVLYKMCDQYNPLSGNFILSSTFEFITATCTEPALECASNRNSSRRFPGYLRDRTGLGTPYGLMVFPMSRDLDFATSFQVLPDMNFWIAAINDLLSFYKEYLAGDKINYIYNRANVEERDPIDILQKVKDEVLEASQNVSTALKALAPESLPVWQIFEAGVIAWHLQQERYKLKGFIA